jgi:transcriptional regulator with XRE-family HTH domain
MQIGRNLKELRERARLTQRELADRAKVSLSIIFQIEQGARTDPRISTIAALADALGVDCRAFLEEPTAQPPQRRKPAPSTKRRPKG